MNSLINLINHQKSYSNSHKSFLIEQALKKNEGQLGPAGELVIKTGKHTGRSANDKYVVDDESTHKKVWWENNVNKMEGAVFQKLFQDVIDSLKTAEDLYFTERSIGNSSIFSLGIETVSTKASAALFTQYMFKSFEASAHNDTFRIIHAPDFQCDPAKYGTKSSTVIVTNFKEKTTIIVGTHYSGEIKKSMFSIMNFLLPDHGILPMHSGANQNSSGDTFVFFGLSGTGKTTLSTDEGLELIGDDEHGLSDKGVFNFEGGCYAKTLGLTPETEPAIFAASSQFSSFLENVKLSDDRSKIDFLDESLTENGRSSYPLSFINNRVLDGKGKIPENIFYLSADAFGVLPPVSLLNANQAMEFFELGYSAKLAGTEIGIKSPVATFSTCFGAPFMLRHSTVYSGLLKEFMSRHNIKVWLINTGWYGGGYGVGKRFPLKVTRAIIRHIQAGNCKNAEFIKDQTFDLNVPKHIEGIDSTLLIPANAWKNKTEYQKAATTLSDSFKTQLSKMRG